MGLASGALALVPYDPRWARAFAALAAHFRDTLPEGTRVEHIGSTAVPGLAAKPILDLVVIADTSAFERVAEPLVAQGWTDRGERSGRLFIRMENGARTHNLHLHRPTDPEWQDQIRLRDALRTDPAMRAAYEAEKAKLIAEGTLRRDYAAAKGPFIARVLGRDG